MNGGQTDKTGVVIHERVIYSEITSTKKVWIEKKRSLWAGLGGDGAFFGPIFFDCNLNGEGNLL